MTTLCSMKERLTFECVSDRIYLSFKSAPIKNNPQTHFIYRKQRKGNNSRKKKHFHRIKPLLIDIIFILFLPTYKFSRADTSSIHWLRPPLPCWTYRAATIHRMRTKNRATQRPQRQTSIWAPSGLRIKCIRCTMQTAAPRLSTNIIKYRTKMEYNGRK